MTSFPPLAPRRLLVLVMLLAAAASGPGCSCKTNLGPLKDTPPADLGPTGVFVEQPKAGETISGQWVAVSGWYDPSKFEAVFVTGAPVDGFYEGSGHVGIPTTRLLLTAEGRFIAPRVPLAEGDTTITLIPIPIGGGQADAITLHVTGVDIASVPATVTATPASGPAPLAVDLKAHAAASAPGWQWDFEGDGVFDAEGATASHTFENVGRTAVLARTKLEGRWIYALTTIVSTEEAPATHTAAVAAHARLLTVVPAPPTFEWPPPPRAPDAEFSETLQVLVADDEGVKGFDARLAPRFRLTPPGEVRGLSGDTMGGVWVATASEVRRYLPDAGLDTSVGDGGVWGGFTDLRGLCVTDDHLDRGDDGGVTFDARAVEWVVLDGKALERCGGEACSEPGSGLPANAGRLRCAARPVGSSLERAGIVFADGAPWQYRLVGSKWHELASGAWADFAVDEVGTPFPYRVGVQSDGTIAEWYVSERPVRVRKLPYAAETMALDLSASLALKYSTMRPGPAVPGVEHFSFVPVVFVAGAGRLERRVLGGLDK